MVVPGSPARMTTSVMLCGVLMGILLMLVLADTAIMLMEWNEKLFDCEEVVEVKVPSYCPLDGSRYCKRVYPNERGNHDFHACLSFPLQRLTRANART